MTTTNTSIETSGVRELSATETADVGGGFFATYFRRLNWQIQNAPGASENFRLVGCSSDMSSCTWQEN